MIDCWPAIAVLEVLEQTAHPPTCQTGRVVNERKGGFEPARQRAVQVQDERGDVGPRGDSVVTV